MDPELWHTLPLEIVSEIISRITDVRDISRLLRTSRYFHYLTSNYVEHITSQELIIIPALFLNTLSRLRSIDSRVVIRVTFIDIPLITSLQWLNEAHFLNTTTELIESLLQVLNLKNGKFKITIEPDHNHVNFRSIIIEKNRYIILPTLYGNLLKMIECLSLRGLDLSSTGLNLQNVTIGMKRRLTLDILREEPLLMKKSMRKFLSCGNFGLIDPTKPPSAINLPITSYLRNIIESNTVTINILESLLRIYIKYHLVCTQEYILMDELMIDLFGPQSGSNLDEIQRNDIGKFLGKNLLYINTTLEDVVDFNIPSTFISQDDLTQISTMLHQTSRTLIVLCHQQSNYHLMNAIFDSNIGYYDIKGHFHIMQVKP